MGLFSTGDTTEASRAPQSMTIKGAAFHGNQVTSTSHVHSHRR